MSVKKRTIYIEDDNYAELIYDGSYFTIAQKFRGNEKYEVSLTLTEIEILPTLAHELLKKKKTG